MTLIIISPSFSNDIWYNLYRKISPKIVISCSSKVKSRHTPQIIVQQNSNVEEIRMHGGNQQEYTYEQYVIDVEKNENTYVVTAKDTKENVLEVVKVKYVSE